MPKPSTVYVCASCDAQFPKWQGRCGECGGWGTLALLPISPEGATPKPPAEIISLANLTLKTEVTRLTTGTAEIDRVFGGGIVAGSVTLLAGEPGIGKSTLVAHIANAVAAQTSVVYISGEESISQVHLRLKRIGCDAKRFNVIGSTDIDAILSAVEQARPGLVIIDSIQTVHTSLVPQESGSLNQIRAAAVRCLEIAKKYDIAMMLVGHITKDGAIAGPKSLEHLVDTVLYLEQETARGYQLLRATKNRFGSTNEIGLFEMTGKGFKPVENPTAVFIEESERLASGSAVGCVIEGTRPFLVEIQALVTKTVFGYPQRKTSGFDTNRLQVLAAVINKRTKFNLTNQDIILNVVGGLKTTDPGLDTAVCSAVISSLIDRPLPSGWLILGEVGLGGEIRPIPHAALRLKEGAKLGFTEAVMPRSERTISGITQRRVKNLEELVSLFST